MSGFAGWAKVLIVVGAAMTVTACASYPTEPKYSTRADPAPQPTYGGYPSGSGGAAPIVVTPSAPYESPPPATAPIGEIDGGALDAPVPSGSYVPPTEPGSGTGYSPPTYNPPNTPRPAVTGGVAYVIQPGDTISGVGRRFQTPVQSLIDLNNLGPRAAISVGQSVTLPDTAVDTGRDPYATGAAPVGVLVPQGGAMPPPPTPPSGNAALPAAPRQTAPAPTPMPPPVRATPVPVPAQTPSASTGSLALQWPVRGEIVRRFGPVGVGERNNGINIGASAGAAVNASAAGRVAYVGDDLVGQGLTVLLVHRDGWRTVYGHLGSATVEDGADVRAGQQIGTVGLTAGDGRPSMHFETRRMQGDNPVAVDPLTVLPR